MSSRNKKVLGSLYSLLSLFSQFLPVGQSQFLSARIRLDKLLTQEILKKSLPSERVNSSLFLTPDTSANSQVANEEVTINISTV